MRSTNFFVVNEYEVFNNKGGWKISSWDAFVADSVDLT
jgi:hypothetical protein